MVTKPSTEQTQDFSIHNEDFPALPGPNYKDATLNNDESKTVSVSREHFYRVSPLVLSFKNSTLADVFCFFRFSRL